MVITHQCCNIINVRRWAMHGDAIFLGVELKYENKSKKD
jgi:hypothetical protein